MWHVIRIAYFSQDKTPLLLGPVKQLVTRLREQFSLPVFVTSHWKFGPHLDLTLKCDQGMFDDAVWPAASDVLERWLAEHPSDVVLNPAEYERLSYQLAMSELEPPPYLPLLENNSVTRADYQRSKAINVDAFHDTREMFLVGSMPVIFQLLALRQQSSDQFFTTLILMMAAVAARFGKKGIARGYVSFRSHAEFFFENFDKTGQMRQRFELLDQKFAQELDANLEAAADGLADKLAVSPAVKAIMTDWEQVVAKTYAANQEVVTTHYDQIIQAEEARSTTEQNFGELAEQISEALPDDVQKPGRDFNTGKVVKKAMEHQAGRNLFRSVHFISYRTTVNYFYVLLPVLDISPVQKFSLCHLLANAVERVYQVNWQRVIPNTDGEVSGGEHA